MRDHVDRRLSRGRFASRPTLERCEERLLLSGGFSQYPIGDSFPAQRFAITEPRDGIVWFTDSTGNLGRLAPDGTVSLIPVRSLAEGAIPILTGMTTAPDGTVWFSGGDGIGKIAPDGTIATIDLHIGPTGIAVDGSGNPWYLDAIDSDHAFRYNIADGTITTFNFPGPSRRSTSDPGHIVLGSDGNIWLARPGNDSLGIPNAIDRITPDGTVTEFPVDQTVNLVGLAAGPGGNVWFTEDVTTTTPEQGRVGRLASDGSVVEYPVPGVPEGITTDPDGNAWFVIYTTGQIGRISPTGKLDLYAPPAGEPPLVHPEAITVGSDGALWFTDAGADRIGRLDPTTATPEGGHPTPPPSPPPVGPTPHTPRTALPLSTVVSNAPLNLFALSHLRRFRRVRVTTGHRHPVARHPHRAVLHATHPTHAHFPSTGSHTSRHQTQQPRAWWGTDRENGNFAWRLCRGAGDNYGIAAARGNAMLLAVV